MWNSIVHGGGDVATTLAFLFWVRVGERMDSNQTWSISGVSNTERLPDPCSLLPGTILRRAPRLPARSNPSGPNQRTSDEQMEMTMKMGCCLFVAISLLVFSNLASADDLIVGNQVYRNYQVIRTQFDGIVIKHSAGIATLYFWDLPADLQKKYNYDPAKVTEVRPADPVPQALPATPVPPLPPSGDGLQDTPSADETPGSPAPAVPPDSGFRIWDDPTYGSFSTIPPGWTQERWERYRLEREREWLRRERERREKEARDQTPDRPQQPVRPEVAQPAARQPTTLPAVHQPIATTPPAAGPKTAQPAVHQAPPQPAPQPHVSPPPPAQQSQPSPKQQPPPSQNKKNGQ